jgi:N-methylhydantoinase A/oxoprolinase/acetone carboxylase beta subunit
VATNALLEGKGARVALVTTAGFEDLLEIGRQNRPQLYALHPSKAPPLVKRSLRFGLRERCAAGGTPLQKPTPEALRALSRALKHSRCEAIAVCLLHSYANPAHEQTAARSLRSLGKSLSLSSEICPEFREYERCSTVCVNAYVAPVMSRYLGKLKARIAHPIRVLQSNGGSLSVAEASRESVRTLLSGPAGGALGALQVARRAGFDRILSFDMGGTSSDLSLIDGDLEMTSEATLGEYAVKTPMIRIDTLGAGGGSLAWIDAGGALRVGPQSAGAIPGPICYGKGGRQITLTDAHLALGRISAEDFLGGRMKLFPEKIRAPLAKLARTLKCSPERAAEGIVRVANANLVRSLRLLTLERGHDPRRFTLLAFGGAGALHAAELAEALEIKNVLVPRHPGLLSAYGMAFAEWRRDYVRTLLKREHELNFSRLKQTLADLEKRALQDAKRERIEAKRLRLAATLELRYWGQSFELSVPFSKNFRKDFIAAHRRRYGYVHRGGNLEFVNLRLQAMAEASYRTEESELPHSQPPTPKRQKVYWQNQGLELPVFRRETLPAHFFHHGPALVMEFSATTFLPPGWELRVLPSGEMQLTRQGGFRP